MLQQPTGEIIEQADKLLAEQRRYASFTGNMRFLVRTACNFSGRIRATDPNQALTWARMAKSAEPWDAHAWTNEAAALLALGERTQALGRYSEAILRFPDNAVPRTGRAEVLKSLDRLDEALAAYEETKDRFPDNAVAHTGRAEVLKYLDRLDEALAAYEETIKRFPDNDVARNGRAEVLKSLGRLDEALAAYEETRDRFPDDVVARNGRAEILKSLDRLDEALAAYEETIKRFPDNDVARNGRAEVLKSLDRLDEALAAYEETMARFPEDEVARTGRDGVLRAMQQGQAVSLKEEIPLSGQEAPVNNKVIHPLKGSYLAADIQGKEGFAPLKVAEEPAVFSPKGPALNREEITLLTTDAYLIRRWAREGKEDDPWLNPGIQRQRAHELLQKLFTEKDHDSLAAGESGMLSLATGAPADRQRALDLLRVAARRFPGSPRVRYALARAEREEAMATKNAAAMTAWQWKKLVRLDRHLFPLQWLGPVPFLARFSTSEGELRENVGELAAWLFPRFQAKDTADPSFYTWWGSAVYGFLFGDAMVRDASELPEMAVIRQNIRTHYRDLVTKEEEIVYRHARR